MDMDTFPWMYLNFLKVGMLLHASLNLKSYPLTGMLANTSPRALTLACFELTFYLSTFSTLPIHVHIKEILIAKLLILPTMTAFVCVARSRHATLSLSERSAQIRYTILKTTPIEHAVRNEPKIISSTSTRTLSRIASTNSKRDIASWKYAMRIPSQPTIYALPKLPLISSAFPTNG